MKHFNQFDISDVFNEINDPLFIIDSEEIIFFNKFFLENFIPISDSWREVLMDDGVVQSIDIFFEKGEVPKNVILNSLRPIKFTQT